MDLLATSNDYGPKIGMIIFDLNESVTRSIESIRPLIEQAKSILNKSGITQNKTPWKTFPKYLRLLDGKADGRLNSELVDLCGDEADEKAVSEDLAKARNWRDENYPMLHKEIACLFKHPKMPAQVNHCLRSSYKK